MAPRESWTDERLDDFAKHVDARFNALERHMDGRFNDLTRMIQIVFAVLGAVLTANTAMLIGLLGWIVTQS
ncbi:MAG TPA: hypothetical protein VFU11_09230 [Solirubrobacterales bacterium]|nr:hypothetical protein [Solirubrobacterales bacterium]